MPYKFLKIKKTLIALCLLLTLLSPLIVSASSLDEIQVQIDQQQANLASIQSQLDEAKENLNSLQAGLNQSLGEIPRLEAEIKELEAEIIYNELQSDLLSEQEKLKELEREERELKQERAVHNAYRRWRAESPFGHYLFSSNDDKHPLKSNVYQNSVIRNENSDINQLVYEIDSIVAELRDYASETEQLKTKGEELKIRKQQVEARIIALQGSYSITNSAVAGLQGQANVVQAKIAQLSAEQKALQEYEAWILGQSGNGGTYEVQDGQIYFTGKGREYYTGHGVGMSQYGAYGLANNGWTASQILTHYYTGVSVGQYPASEEISIKYCPGNPVFDPYQDGCDGGAAPVVERVSLDSYLAGLGEMPDIWPIEARKAQMIAARTYALRYTGNGNPAYPICLTTYCQVSYFKSGDQNEMDAVQQTKNLVITYNGELIEALYSADNNNGWGTANNDTVFSNINGDSSAYPYLRSVQEPSGAGLYPTYNFNWGWRTNGYTFAHLDSMLAFAQGDGYLSAGSRNYISSIRNAIGNISSMSFERDPSGRVKKVILTGTNGVSMPMAGWFFKTVWNSWVDQVTPSGQKDFIYSLTYFLLTQ